MWSGKASEEVTLEPGPEAEQGPAGSTGGGESLAEGQARANLGGGGVTSMASTVWEQQGSPSSHRGVSVEARGGEKLRSYREATPQCLAGPPALGGF